MKLWLVGFTMGWLLTGWYLAEHSHKWTSRSVVASALEPKSEPIRIPERDGHAVANKPVEVEEKAVVRRWSAVGPSFGSELSAKGLAEYLQRTDGGRYRVSYLAPRLYQVEKSDAPSVEGPARPGVMNETAGKSVYAR